MFLGGIHYARDFKSQVEHVQERLGVNWRPHVELIVGMTFMIGVLFAILAVGIAAVMLFPGWLPRVTASS